MKRFAFQFTLFLIPIIVLSYLGDVYISQKLKKSKLHLDEYSVWSDLYDGKINSDVVIYGSSRAWVHINSTMISDSLHKSTYNLGIDGHNFWLQYFRHKLLLQYNRKPKTIVYSLDIFTLKKRDDLYNAEQFLPYMPFNSTLKSALSNYKGFTHWDFELPLIRYYGKARDILAANHITAPPKEEITSRVKGYQGQAIPWTNDLEEARKVMKSFKIELDTPTIILFEKFINECRQEGIKLVFVYSPEYIEGQEFEEGREHVISLYTSWSKKYDIPFYDYSSDSMSYQRNYFFNSMHLNKKGAEVFTGKLIEKFKSTNVLE